MTRTIEAGAASLQRHFGPDVLCDVVRVDEDPARLLPEEQESVSQAVPARRREFAAGRVCARELLSRLGFAAAPILRAPDRRPLWPHGAVGSIAHDGTMCAVAVARADRLASLGLDVEPDEPLEDELWPTICTRRELAALGSSRRASRLARILFSAKECVYKCIYPLTQRPLDFQDVEIEFLPGADRFRATLLPVGASPASLRLDGFHLACAGSIVTGLRLRSAPGGVVR